MTETSRENPQLLRWNVVPEESMGGWAIVTDGDEFMIAEFVVRRKLAQHIVDVHNQWLDQQEVTTLEPHSVHHGQQVVSYVDL